MSKDGLNGSGRVVEVYDTTLRDGTQMEGLSLSCDDKLRIAEHLDTLGVAFIEGGWPGSNPKDVEFFERAKDVDWKNVTLAASNHRNIFPNGAFLIEILIYILN